ncbi:MAG TPA: hypothetical protein VIK89_01660 [Cytophagaceae bacterium]
MSYENKLILEQLDFSGGSDSWFNFWRIYFDWDGEGNTDPKLRKQFFEEMILFYQELKLQLKGYSKPYQLWIQVHEQDSSQNAVYLHTPNPEDNNFPFRLATIVPLQGLSKETEWLINKAGLKAAMVKESNQTVIYLYDNEKGEALI